MSNADDSHQDIEALRNRLSRLSEASIRINASLDFNTVLQGVLDSARSLTGATYGCLVLLDDSLQVDDFLASGMTREQAEGLRANAGPQVFEHIGGMVQPVRHGDFPSYLRELGLTMFDAPMPLHSPLPVLFAPITLAGKPTGIIYLCDTATGTAFMPEDEEILVMFAAQAALVIANARYHRVEQRARADLEALVRTAPVGVLVFDARTGEPVYVNQETLRIGAEVTSAELSLQEMIDCIEVRRADGTVIPIHTFPVAATLSAGETVRAEEMDFTGPEGKHLSVVLNATPIRSADDVIESFVITLQDMTPLEDLERMRAEFLGMVSHELRSPLVSIKGAVATLLASAPTLDPSEMDLFFRIIDRQADHMSGLISDLLDAARIEAGALSVSPEPVDPAVLIDQARIAFLGAGGRNRLRIDTPPDLPKVAADRRRIVQVINNLLTNAERNSPDMSTIQLAIVHQGVHVEFSVIDDGVGIPPDHLPHLFRKFSQPSGGGRESKGSGLGLAIANGIVEAHGGRIWAESDGTDKGARFTFSLPVVNDFIYHAESRLVDTPLSPPGSGRRRIRVLAVDDDPQTLRYIRDTLADAGYAPFTTGDPGAVARLIEEKRPHLVLLDLLLPGMDGIDLMEGVSELDDIPVIFLSAYGRDQIIARAIEAGADDYIVKPFSPTELVARIGMVLRRRMPDGTVESRGPYTIGDLTVNYAERRVYLKGRPVHLTDIECRMLVELMAHAGQVLTHAELLQRVWGPAHSGRTGAVRSAIKNLRRKLGDDADNPAYITNVPRVGYRMLRREENV